MLAGIQQLFQNAPLLALFLTIVLGYFIGKFQIKTFILGGIAGSLIMGVVIGQIGVKLSPAIGSIFFALFIYAVGYQGGPQFFRSLNRDTLMQLVSAALTCVLGLVCVLVAAWLFKLDRGTAAGLAAGGLTQSAMIGTANDAIAKLGLNAHLTDVMQTNVAVGYAVCYIFGSFGPILMLTAVFPAMMRWNLRQEAKKLAVSASGAEVLLEPGQFPAIGELDTRVYEITSDSKAIGKTAADLFEQKHRVTIEALLRDNQLIELKPDTLIQDHDIVAVTAPVDEFIFNHEFFTKEIAKPASMQLTEEVKTLVLSNKEFEGKTLNQSYELTNNQDNYGIIVTSISRLGEKIKPDAQFILKRGDEIKLRGRPEALDKVVSKLGIVIRDNKITDFISFGLGMMLGILIGMISVPLFGVSVSLGTGGGCLLSGLLFGWFRSRHPRFGALPEGASNFLRDFGLAVFVATVGINAGPEAIQTIRQYGMELFLLGVGVTIIPQIISFYLSYYLLGIKNPIELLATIAGGRSANPGFAALLDKAGNSTPVVPFTAAYAIANILLTLWGPIIVALVTKNVS